MRQAAPRQRDATGERSVSLAKIGAVLPAHILHVTAVPALSLFGSVQVAASARQLALTLPEEQFREKSPEAIFWKKKYSPEDSKGFAAKQA